MTVEVALVSLLALGAFVALFLGLAQALEGRPPAARPRPAPRAPVPDAADAADGDAPPAAGAVPPAVAAPSALAEPTDPDGRRAAILRSPFARRPVPPRAVPDGLPLGAVAARGNGSSGHDEFGGTREALPREPAAPPDAAGPGIAEQRRDPAPEGRPAGERIARDAAVGAPGPEPGPHAVEPAPPAEPTAVVAAASAASSPDTAADDAPPLATAPADRHGGRAAADGGSRPADDEPAAASALDRSAALFQAGRYAELLEAAGPRLRADLEADGPGAAALASLAGLAEHERGDAGAARQALERAARLAPGSPAEPCPPRVAALALPVARRLLEAGGDPGEAGVRAALARFWLEWRLVAAPGDPDTADLLDKARAAAAAAAGDAVAQRLRAREWGEARRAADAAAARGDVDGARAAMLDRLIASAVKREVERLVAPAIRGGRDEPRAVHALEQAEALLAALPADVLPAAARAALGRRVSWAHARLGIQRVRAGRAADGLDALARALERKGLGPERLRRVRETAVEAVEALAARAADAAAQPDGHAAAAALLQDLEAAVGRARAAGVPPRLLAPVEQRAGKLAAELQPGAAR